MTKRVLIANRGEIACRIIKTAKQIGLHTIALYSEPDQHSLHVQLADEAYALPGATANDTYLDIDAVIDIAQQSQADFIHPGYGFLSENAAFVSAVEQANITFVGPPAQVIETMGSKQAAKNALHHHAVPQIPGYHSDDQSEQALINAAKSIGFPVLIKAALGGGGKGMRVVDNEDSFTEHLSSCRREAKSAFNDDAVILEKFCAQARHVEVQIAADQHGNIRHLFHRDCSLQRRHQKVIEEAPAWHLSSALSQKILQAAIEVAKAIQYVGVGTVEFLVDGDQFYFLEMNTRLQVEHPITELITGIDLVEWQFLIASGESIPLEQSAIQLHGHAIEARLYAENTQRSFLPSQGTLQKIIWPESARIDTGVKASDQITIYYDPMIAKLSVHADNRALALTKLYDCLSQTTLLGVEHNIGYLKHIIDHPAVQSGEYNTHWIEHHVHELNSETTLHWALIAATLYRLLYRPNTPLAYQHDPQSPWLNTDSWRMNHHQDNKLNWFYQDTLHPVGFSRLQHQLRFVISNHIYLIDTFQYSDGSIQFEHEHQQLTAHIIERNNDVFVSIHGEQTRLQSPTTQHQQSGQSVQDQIRSPMPGQIIAVAVASGDHVQQGELLVRLEAMKMEHSIKAPCDAIIETVIPQTGDQVQEGQLLIKLLPNTEDSH